MPQQHSPQQPWAGKGQRITAQRGLPSWLTSRSSMPQTSDPQRNQRLDDPPTLESVLMATRISSLYFVATSISIIFCLVIYWRCQYREYIVSNDRIDERWTERDLEESGVVYSRYHPGVFVEWLRKNTRNSSQDGRCLGWHLDSVSPEYKSGRYREPACSAVPNAENKID